MGRRDVAEVIRLTEQRPRELKPKLGSAFITEVVTQAHLFRDVRNYALHPVEGHDRDRETWLTETGATLLAIAARRYFVKLDGLRTRLLGGSRVGSHMVGGSTSPDVPSRSSQPLDG